jgi:hypothetical protein
MAAWDPLRGDCEGGRQWRPAVRFPVFRRSAVCLGIREPASAGHPRAWERSGRRRRTSSVGRLLVVVAVLASGLLAVPVTASASCVGPALSYDVAQVRPGDTVRVVGQYWGDDCFDTGRPPVGQGVLGPPRQGIAVVFEQGGTQTVVARGNADGYYQFQVDIAIPQTADPGGGTTGGPSHRRGAVRGHGGTARGGLRRARLTVGGRLVWTHRNPGAVIRIDSLPVACLYRGRLPDRRRRTPRPTLAPQRSIHLRSRTRGR